jgi:ATP-dependent Clp protease ATP-binding subunit ClpB
MGQYKEARTLESAWRKEKDLIDELKSIREQIDSLKVEADNYEREGNF